MVYLLDLTPDDNGTLLITSAAFPELTSFAESETDAREKGLRAVEEAIAARIDEGQSLPPLATASELKRFAEKPGSRIAVRLPALITLKMGLYNALKKQRVTRAELARRLGWHRESVDRLFRLDHNSRLDQIEAAFAQLHQDIDVRVREMSDDRA